MTEETPKAKVWVTRNGDGTVNGLYPGGRPEGTDEEPELVDFDHPDVLAFQADHS